jgi:hypothetical protein
LLAAGLQHRPVLAHRLHQPLAFVDGQRQRLLAIYVLARPHRRQVHQGVPMVRTALDHHVHIVPFHHPPQIARLRRRLAVLGELLDRGIRVTFVHIAHRHDLAEPRGVLGVPAPHPAAADQRDPWTVIGSEQSA